MVLGAFVTYVSRSSCAAQPRTSRPFLRAGADFGGFLPGPLCSVGAEVLGPAHVRMCVCCRCTHSCYYYHTQIVLTPPEAGQVPATRRSEATPRPRAGCPPASAAGLIMTVKHHAHGQNELFRPGLLPSRSPPGQEERQVSFPGGEQPSRRPARSGAPRAAGWVRVRWLPGAPRAPSRRGDRSEAIG